MLTSASQYLHPDYLQPLPTTLDAKKSPLALLAQTCSSIGKDSTPSKSIIPPLEKSSKDSKDTSSNSSNNGDSKPGSPKNDEGKSSDKKDRSSPHSDSGKSGSFRAPAPKDIPPLVPISGGSSGDKSPAPGEASTSKSSSRDGHHTPTSSSTSQAPRSPSASAGINSNSRISLSCGNMLLEVNHHESALAAAKASASSSIRPEMPSAVHPTLGPYHHLGLGHSIEALAASSLSSHHPSLTAHSLASAASRTPGAPSISPYSYARVKTSAGATTLVPICRDPYCTNCQITMQGAQLSSACAAGCTQCNHEKAPAYHSVPTSLGGISSLGGSVPILPFPPSPASLPPTGASALHMASSLYGHAFGILPGHHTLPYVCNWMAGSDYCGKRFSTSEELLQHLRTHTSSSEAAIAGLQGLPGLGLHSAAALAAAGCHSHLNPPPSLSPNSLRQAYPRSLSPNTLLAASRYHPYKHLSSLPPAPAGLPSALSAYYSPYALYGQRLAASAVAP